MKKSIFLLLASLLLVPCVFAGETIIVRNLLDINRSGEMVEIKTKSLKSNFVIKSYILRNEKGKEIPYQLLKDGSQRPVSLIFQADVPAKGVMTYNLNEGKPAVLTPKTYARFVPERKDDFAWENDMAAYRMYGPALANENPSNGVDYWAKCTDKLVVDQRYKDEEFNHISYHIDHGLGLDFYKVAHTLGCGGISPYVSGKLWVGNHFDSYNVLVNGPLRSVFTLTYDSVMINKEVYKEVITITTDAGSLLNKAEVQYIGKEQDMKMATGIYLQDGKGNLKVEVANGIISYAENAVSNAGVPSGRNYVGVFVPAKVSEFKNQDDHGLLLTDYSASKSFSYYFGGGWSKWHYKTDADWFNAVKQFAKKARRPLIVLIK